MRILIHLAHPAHYHLFKHVVNRLRDEHEVHISYNEKDVLEKLIDPEEVPVSWHRIRTGGERKGKWAFLGQFVRKELGFFRLAKRLRPDILVGTPIIIAHAGWLLGIPSVIVNEDDFDVISSSTAIGYPFASVIVAPRSCSPGKWGQKTVHYDGYHELAYLRSDYFKPDRSVVEDYLGSPERYFLLRFSSLSAHHDIGKSGISTELALDLVAILEKHGKVFVNSEKQLDPALEAYKLPVHPRDIHHVLYFADLYAGDSQTMAAEAAVLGTPSVRYNDFVGKLGYLAELEHSYQLTVGISTGDTQKLRQTVETIVSDIKERQNWRDRAMEMQADKDDVTAWLADFIVTYGSNPVEAKP